MRRWFSWTVVLISSLAVGPLGGCALDELPGSISEADESLGSVSQESIIPSIIKPFRLRAGLREGGRTVGAGQISAIVESGPTPGPILVFLAASDGYEFSEVHVAPAQNISGIPLNPAGCPPVGLFPESASPTPRVSEIEMSLPVDEVNIFQGWFLAVHVGLVHEDGTTESAWGEGDDLPDCPSPAMVVPVPALDPIPGIASERGDE